MSLCCACQKYLHPDWFIEIEENVHRCVFCETGRQELTKVVDGKEIKITKQICIDDYKRYIDTLVKSDKIAELLVKK
jgi:hypothetical protein